MLRVTRTVLLVLLLAAPAVLAACASFAELRLGPEVERADAAFNRGDYALAATCYESLVDRYPDAPQREELKLRQGIALYTLGSYHDARDTFQAYLQAFPVGSHKAEVMIYLGKIEALLSPENPKLKAAIESARKDLDALQQLHVQNPYNPAIDYAIGNLYYEMGNYNEAVRYYFDAQTIDAAYKEKTLIQQRMIIDDNGQPQPLTPEEQARIERDEQPLVVFDTHQYMSREPYPYSNNQNRFFNVTGLVRNQSSRFVPNAVVEVRFVNTSNQVMDVAVVPIGPMGPGEVRPFRAEADSYDNIYNITAYNCIPRVEW